MSKIRVAINGFGRIGRLSFRRLMENPDIEIVAINDLSQLELLAHLLKYDSVQGKADFEIAFNGNILEINNHEIQTFQERDPENLPWKALNIDVVLESTGVFRTSSKASKHLLAGARRVVLSAPPKSDDIPMVVLGVNEDVLKEPHSIISNSSCTTNCIAPMCKIIDDAIGISKGFLTTVHAYTSSQNLVDGPNKDFRRARAAALSITPTTTGAATAVTKVLPQLVGKLDGMALRVPVPTGSISDFTLVLDRNTSKEEVNGLFEDAAKSNYKGIVQYLEDELVSQDIIGNTHSCIFDPFISYVNENLIKINAWYDNEYGYSSRTAELIYKIGALI